jgi:hypothetical protein
MNHKHYHEHIPRQPSWQVLAGEVVPGPQSRGWEALQAAVGVDDPAVGERVTVAAEGASPLTGIVGIGGPDEETVYAVFRTYFFGPDAEQLAARDEPAWRALVSERVGATT